MPGRIRSIKPEVLEDELAAGLSDAAWRLWVSSWVLADDHGNLRLGEKYLAANVWQDTSRDVATPLKELIDKGRLEPYAVRGQRYGHIHAFDRHQRVDNAGKPRVPGPSENDCTWNQEVTGSFSVSVGDPQRPSETFREIPLARAPAQSGGETTTTTTTTTSEGETRGTPGGPTLFPVGEPNLPRDKRDLYDAVLAAFQDARRGRYPDMTKRPLKLDKDRQAAIDAAVKMGFTRDDLVRAVRGFVLDGKRERSDARCLVWALQDAATIEASLERMDRIDAAKASSGTNPVAPVAPERSAG